MKKRLDVIIYEKGLAESREKAKTLIMSGNVYVNNEKADKPGMTYDDISSDIEVRGKPIPYVSRGGLKLEKAINEFNISLKDKVTMDIGASTGGFTDCMLQNGAVKVYSIDVGYGQLAWSLRNDKRVINLERTNIRYLPEEIIKDKIDFFSIDVSFISLKLVLPQVKNFIHQESEGVCLIKPQFEAGKEKVGKNGIVRDELVHVDVINMIIDFSKSIGFDIKGITFSPIKGAKGNIEYLIHLKNSEKAEAEVSDGINAKEIVKISHKNI